MSRIISSVCTDTRQGAEGALFFALRGENSDGHDYVANAFIKGAVAAVVEREVPGVSGTQIVVPDTLAALGDFAAYFRDGFSIPLVAVTGSVGKTSTKEMVAAALGARYVTLASEKNFNNEIGVPLTLFKLEPEHEAAVVEMGMRGLGEIARLAEIARPTVGVITNIGLSHIERLGSRDGIARAKAELLEALPDDGLAVVPADDAYAAFLLDTCRQRCPAVTFGHAENSDYRVTNLTYNDEGCPRFAINDVPFELSTPGTHHPVNAAAAAAVAVELGVRLDEVALALADYRAPAMRMETLVTQTGITVLNDAYNAAPDSMRAALETLVMFAGGRRAVAVLGEMRELGDYSPEAHRFVGQMAGGQPLGLLVTVGLAAEGIAREASKSLDAGRIRSFPSTAEAATALLTLLEPGDVVLVKGSRAMEMERIVEAISAR